MHPPGFQFHWWRTCSIGVRWTMRSEALYLTAILNSETARERAAEYQAREQWGARHLDKVRFNLPIPRFDARERLLSPSPGRTGRGHCGGYSITGRRSVSAGALGWCGRRWPRRACHKKSTGSSPSCSVRLEPEPHPSATVNGRVGPAMTVRGWDGRVNPRTKSGDGHDAQELHSTPQQPASAEPRPARRRLPSRRRCPRRSGGFACPRGARCFRR